MMLGRCRVRVVGVHSPDKTEVPVEGLPWAVPLQPITSAAMNGIGHTPLGPVEGSWVMIVFTDPESKQQPVMLGTFGGIPSKENIYDTVEASPVGLVDGVISTTEGPIKDSDGKDIKVDPPPESDLPANTPILGDGAEQMGGEPVQAVAGEMGYLQSHQIDSVLAACRQRESSNNYRAVNTLGFSGAYQMGMAALEDTGYIKKGSWSKYKKNKHTADPGVWSGKDGIKSREDFLNNPAVQDKAIRQYWHMLYKRMKSADQVSATTPAEKIGGLLMVAHLKGTGKGGVRDFLKGQAAPDGYGTSPNEYYNIGFKAVDPARNPVAATKTAQVQNTTIRNTEIQPVVDGTSISGASIRKGDPTVLGFVDPKLRYPLDHMINEPDTNRLARHQKLGESIVVEKMATRETKISLANNNTFTWEQPSTPYNAQYPYNHVYMSESGHIVEYDDTPGNERLHTYHAAGTFTEIDKAGNRTTKVVGTDVTIVEQDGLIYIKGTGALNIDGKFSLDIKDTANVFINGDVQLHVKGNMKQIVEGEIHTRCTSWHLQTKQGITMLDNEDIWPNEVPDPLWLPETKESEGIKMYSKTGEITALADEKKVKLTSAQDEVHILGEEYVVLGKKVSSYRYDGTFWGQLKGSVSPGGGGNIMGAQAAVAAPEADKINREWDPELSPIDSTNFIDSQSIQLEDEDEGVAASKSYSFDPPDDNSTMEAPSSAPQFTAPPPTVAPTIEYPVTRATRLSPNFTIGDLCKEVNKTPIPPAAGQRKLTQAQLIHNMQQLCINFLEPMKVAYPNMLINSGLRAPKRHDKISQHELGQAVDIGFSPLPKGVTGRRRYYYDAAEYIMKNMAFDQLLLEFTDSGSAWVHVSWNASGNRAMGSGLKVGTLNNHTTYAREKLVIPGTNVAVAAPPNAGIAVISTAGTSTGTAHGGTATITI